MSTYSEFQSRKASEKVTLAVVEASRRLCSWSVYSGSVYQISFSQSIISSITQDGTALTEVASIAAISSGNFYLDRSSDLLYLQCSASEDPDSVFIAVKFKNFFSDVGGIRAAWDLSTGFDVEWLPLIKPSSRYAVEVEGTQSLLGVAISSDSSVTFFNDKDFWSAVYDKWVFDSHTVWVYSWGRFLPVAEATLIYKGRVDKLSWNQSTVNFSLKDVLDELRSPVSLSDMSELSGALIPDSVSTAKQRRIYGYIQGHVPTPVDQSTPENGYEITGTVSVTSASATVTGSGTLFLKELSPGDSIRAGTSPNKYKVDSIASDTSLTLSENYSDDTESGVAANVFASHPKRWQNRVFLVAGHALSRPSTTVTDVIDSASFYVASTEELLEGDTIEFGSETGVIRVLGDGFIKLVSGFAVTPSVGSTIYRSSVENVYLGNSKLERVTDFTYDESTAKITLEETAEFNVTRPQSIVGTITVTNGSRTVSGSSTTFRNDLSPGDWIKISTKSNWFEVLDVTNDTSLILRTTPGASDAGSGAAAEIKKPFVYPSSGTLSCDAIGKSDASGNFIRFAGAIAKDLLIDAGLSSSINSSSFDDADSLLPHRLGVAIPEKFTEKKVPTIRDILNVICRSTFSSVIQNNSFELEMSVLEPSFSSSPPVLDESDIKDFPSVSSDARNVVKDARVNYARKEYDPLSAGESNASSTESNAQYLRQTEKEFEIDTALIDSEDATIFASRWAFLLSAMSSEIKISTGLNASLFEINDVIQVDHPKLYQRFGSSSKRRIGAILSISKDSREVLLLVNDLGNAFTRCARICEDGSSDYSDATDSEKTVCGYLTDDNGLTEGVEGINLIW